MSAGAAVPASVAIVGLGVMGGSLARALRALPDPPRVLGASPDARDLEAARGAGVLDRASSDPDDVVGDAALVVYAAPLEATLGLLGRHHATWRPGAAVTDVASLKAPVAAKVRALGAASRWVGSHPMAGATASGFEASRPDLYRGARVWICAGDADPPAVKAVEALWRALGAEPVATDAAEHDRLMTWASHLPQLAANALALALEEAGVAPESLGPGGRDATRLAGSAPSMWRDLLSAAGASDAAALRALAGHLAGLAESLERGDASSVAERMERTRRWHGGGAP
ncbi:MAG: prephenate dehydrogenase/arogenate dehydrogenase family protein [Gemmatimonadetes bacterium]|nr:prephenate dehydrogenase/arogenate dehydrogenase family protein [Gemmatimonadota bacterium]